MIEEGPAFRLELHRADGGGADYEDLRAASDEEAIELGHLRLLLGPGYTFVRVWRGEKELAAFQSDGTNRSIHRLQ